MDKPGPSDDLNTEDELKEINDEYWYDTFEVGKSAKDNNANKQIETLEVNLLHKKGIKATDEVVGEVNTESNFIDDDDLTNSENLRWSEEEDLIQSVNAKEKEIPDAQKQSNPEGLLTESEDPRKSKCKRLGCEQKDKNHKLDSFEIGCIQNYSKHYSSSDSPIPSAEEIQIENDDPTAGTLPSLVRKNIQMMDIKMEIQKLQQQVEKIKNQQEMEIGWLKKEKELPIHNAIKSSESEGRTSDATKLKVEGVKNKDKNNDLKFELKAQPKEPEIDHTKSAQYELKVELELRTKKDTSLLLWTPAYFQSNTKITEVNKETQTDTANKSKLRTNIKYKLLSKQKRNRKSRWRERKRKSKQTTLESIERKSLKGEPNPEDETQTDIGETSETTAEEETLTTEENVENQGKNDCLDTNGNKNFENSDIFEKEKFVKSSEENKGITVDKQTDNSAPEAIETADYIKETSNIHTTNLEDHLNDRFEEKAPTKVYTEEIIHDKQNETADYIKETSNIKTTGLEHYVDDKMDNDKIDNNSNKKLSGKLINKAEEMQSNLNKQKKYEDGLEHELEDEYEADDEDEFVICQCLTDKMEEETTHIEKTEISHSSTTTSAEKTTSLTIKTVKPATGTPSVTDSIASRNKGKTVENVTEEKEGGEYGELKELEQKSFVNKEGEDTNDNKSINQEMMDHENPGEKTRNNSCDKSDDKEIQVEKV